eukprot:c8961_g1_i1.p1 GENE.c8961_g1_i1~~c8961_g1_i1.p1  ORF type:complete len:790 (-),score=194.73 c8961_g1_i1:83-2452(-)
MSAGLKQWCGLACGAPQSQVQKGQDQMAAQPVLKDLVLVGGGHAHVHVMKMLAMNPMPGVRITVISRDVESPYSGMIPGHVAGFYTREECHIDVSRVARLAGAVFVHAMATGIDTVAQVVHVNDGRPPIEYDVLSIDIGITPKSDPTIHSSRITPVKPIDGFSGRWETIRQRVLAANSLHPLQIAVVGGGAGGVELCLSMQARLRRDIQAQSRVPEACFKFILFSRTQKLLPTHAPRVGRIFGEILRTRNVEVHLNCDIVGVQDDKLVSSTGASFQFDECLWCTQAHAQEWLRSTGIQLTGDGFVAVNQYIQSPSHPNIFAAGDVATSLTHPRPKAGVFAVRQAPFLLENIRRYLTNQPLKTFVPQTQFLCLIGTGDPETCVLSRGSLAISGPYVWKMKDWIDRKWMAMYTTQLPFDTMAAPVAIPLVAVGDEEAMCVMREAPMRCGGCGSKVGASVLSSVIAALAPTLLRRPEVLSGLDTPDDCAVVSYGSGVACHTVDFFRSFIHDPYTFGRIAAVHALSDCHAMGVAAHTALAIAVVPYAKESKVRATLLQMMAGACRVLTECGCCLVGGHTSEGSQMALGFSVTGVADSFKQVLAKSGMCQGNVLILTKPLGTGTIMAADMRGKVRGRHVDGALVSMCQSNHHAVEVLKQHGAVACTDVTGFGLVGHLAEMCRASSASVTVNLSALPLLDGAVECVAQGVFSTLHPQNVRLKRALVNLDQVAQHPNYMLLFDPQTAGGLLASIPEPQANACLQTLKDKGYTRAAIIGHVTSAGTTPGPEYITCQL